MRTPESKIRDAILHPEAEIRRTALSYFTDAYTTDETLMPLVIQAVEQYGREKSFNLLRRADDLPQTESSVAWLTHELAQDRDLDKVEWDNYACALALVLCRTRTDLLRPDMVELKCFPEELEPAFMRRLETASWDWDTAWSALEDLGREARDRGHFRMHDHRRVGQIVEALARHTDKAELVLRLLDRRYRGFEKDLIEWLEHALFEIAGAMHLQAAAPILVERMLEDDEDLSGFCVFPLTRIGGDRVVQTVADFWNEGDDGFHMGGADVLGRIRTDLSVQKCLEFLPDEEDEYAKALLADALLYNFAEEAIEPVRAMIVDDRWKEAAEEHALREHLAAAATIMGVSFPDLASWYDQAIEKKWGWGFVDHERIRGNFEETEDDRSFEQHLDEELEHEEFEDEELEDDELKDGYEEEPYPPAPIRRETRRVGRNDPCPCGSGKKYKKCCLGREDAAGGKSDISIFE